MFNRLFDSIMYAGYKRYDACDRPVNSFSPEVRQAVLKDKWLEYEAACLVRQSNWSFERALEHVMSRKCTEVEEQMRRDKVFANAKTRWT